jgi:hypothetical protein
VTLSPLIFVSHNAYWHTQTHLLRITHTKIKTFCCYVCKKLQNLCGIFYIPVNDFPNIAIMDEGIALMGLYHKNKVEYKPLVIFICAELRERTASLITAYNTEPLIVGIESQILFCLGGYGGRRTHF